MSRESGADFAIAIKYFIEPVDFRRRLPSGFVGGKVRNIRVVQHAPQLTPSKIKEEVQNVWLGRFWYAASSIGWAEGNRWNIRASVEYEDGKRTSILMDGWVHVQVEDREGKYWFIRIWPAVEGLSPIFTKDAANGVPLRAVPALERIRFLDDFSSQVYRLSKGTKPRMIVK